MLKVRNCVAVFLMASAILSAFACARPITTLGPGSALNSPTPTFTATYTSTTIPPSATPTHWPCYPLTCTLTLTGSPTPPPTFTASPTQTLTSTAASTTSTSTPTIAVPAHTPVSVAKYLLSASSGIGSGMPVTYGLYCLGWYPVGPVTIIDTFDPGFTYNGPNPANTASGPNFTTGANSVTMVWPQGLPTGASWVTFSVVEANVQPSEYCQVRTNQAQIIYQDAAGIHPFTANFSNDSVTMVCPTLTNTPTCTPTNTPTNSPTNSPTGPPTSNPTSCPTGVPASLNLSSGTLAATSASAGTTFVGFVLSTSQNPGGIYNQIVRVQYQAQVTGNLASQIQAAQLWLDNDSNGVISPGDTLLQTITSTPLNGTFLSTTPPFVNSFPAQLIVAFVASGTASGTLQVTLPYNFLTEDAGTSPYNLCVFEAIGGLTAGQTVTLP